MANLTLKAMRRLFAYAVKREMRDDNPLRTQDSTSVWSKLTLRPRPKTLVLICLALP